MFLHAYEADFLQWLLINKDTKLAQTAISMTSCHRTIFDNQTSAAYSDLYLEIDHQGRFKSKTLRPTWWLHFSNSQLPIQQHQRMEYTFHSSYVILLFVPNAVVSWTDLSCWHTRLRCSYVDKGLLQTGKLLNLRLLVVTSNSSLRRIYGRHHDLVDRYVVSVS